MFEICWWNSGQWVASYGSESFFKAIPTITLHHAPSEKLYDFMKNAIKAEILMLFGETDEKVDFQPFGLP